MLRHSKLLQMYLSISNPIECPLTRNNSLEWSIYSWKFIVDWHSVINSIINIRTKLFSRCLPNWKRYYWTAKSLYSLMQIPPNLGVDIDRRICIFKLWFRVIAWISMRMLKHAQTYSFMLSTWQFRWNIHFTRHGV